MMRKALYASLAGNVVLIVLLFVPFGKHPENADATAKSPETSLEKMSEPPKQGFDIMMLGNSLTYGGDWNKLLKRENVKNSGYGGFTTQHFIWLLPEAVYRHRPKICLVEGGINDIGVGVPVGRIYRNLVEIADSLRSHRIIPVYQLTFRQHHTDQNDEVDSLNRMV